MPIALYSDKKNAVQIPAKSSAALTRLNPELPALVDRARTLYERALDAQDAREQAEYSREPGRKGPPVSDAELAALCEAEEEAAARHAEAEEIAIDFPARTIGDVVAKLDLLDILNPTIMLDDLAVGCPVARLLARLRDDVRALSGLPAVDIPEWVKDERRSQIEAAMVRSDAPFT